MLPQSGPRYLPDIFIETSIDRPRALVAIFIVPLNAVPPSDAWMSTCPFSCCSPVQAMSATYADLVLVMSVRVQVMLALAGMRKESLVRSSFLMQLLSVVVRSPAIA